MYNHIVVPMALDHGVSEQNLAVARKLLSEGGKITALHVYEAPHSMASAFIDESAIKEAFNRAKATMVERVKDQGDVEGVVIKGHSGRGIIDYVGDVGADCIVMGSHRPGLIDYLLGATATRVVQHAPCAVHVTRHTE